MSVNEFKFLFKTFPQSKLQAQMASLTHKTVKREIIPFLQNEKFKNK